MPDIIPPATSSASKPTAFDTLMSLLEPGVESRHQAIVAVAEFRSQVEREERHRVAKDALLNLHEYDELIFGGFYCTYCTPDDADDPDQNVYWPCPPLREIGVTEVDAIVLISGRRAMIEARHRVAPKGDAA